MGCMTALQDALSHEVVAVVSGAGAPVLYAHSAFLGAFQEALLERLGARVPEGSSGRAAIRALRRLRSGEGHRTVLRCAIAALRESGKSVSGDAITAQTVIVAVFPGGT